MNTSNTSLPSDADTESADVARADTAPAEIAFEVSPAVIFGPPPLINGESRAEYDALLAGFRRAVKPADFIEEIWVRDVADLTWEVLRYRRMKANLLKVKSQQALQQLLTPLLQPNLAAKLAVGWAKGELGAFKRVTSALASADLTLDAVNARTLLQSIDAFDRIECLIVAAEARRNATLREIDRHRSVAGERLRRAADDVEEAEFEVVTPPRDGSGGES